MSEQPTGRAGSLSPPPLDDVRYADLVAEAVARIPVHAPEWTDHNASDPGITVLEALAYVVDGLGWTLSRYDRRAAAAYAVLLGEEVPDGADAGVADAALARAVRGLGAVSRAVTADDVGTVVRSGVLVLDLPLAGAVPSGSPVTVHQPGTVVGSLARAAKAGEPSLVVDTASVRAGDRLVVGEPGQGAEVVTVVAVSSGEGALQGEVTLAAGLATRRSRGTTVALLGPAAAGTTTLAAAGPGAGSLAVDPTGPADGWSADWCVAELPGGAVVATRVARASLLGPREVVVVGPAGARADAELCETTFQLLRRRSPAAARMVVSAPRRSTVDVSVWVVREPFGLQRTDALRAAVSAALAGFLDPVHGGPDGDGWPVGDPVYRSALFDVLERVPGVDHVHRLSVDGDAESDAWPLAASDEAARRSVAVAGRLEVTVLDAADGW